MIGQVLALSALVALTQAKAIISNNCKHNVYLWSVPGKSGVADNLPIGPGKRYEEPWRYGTSVNPGVAIKVSPLENGINEGKAEINFQYTVDSYDSSKIWINLSLVRSPLHSDIVLFTCHGPYRTPHVPTRQCSYTDDVELVLCGTRRSTPPQDKTSPDAIHDCIGKNHERDATIHPRQCIGRVIGPKPKHEAHDRKDDDDDTSVDIPNPPDDDKDEIEIPNPFDHDSQSVTVPLKNVMRHEAAKHAVLKHAEAAKKQPFCDLIKSHWPEAACNENVSQQNARLFYKDNCGKKSKNMLPGADCQKLRKEIKKIYPDVDKEPKATAGDLNTRKHLSMCNTKAHALLDPLWGSSDVEDLMNGMFTDRAWTSDGDVCHGKSNFTVHPRGYSKERRCVKPYCQPAIALADCSDVEDALEELSKLAGYDIEWTTSDEECGHDWKRNGNKTHL